MDPKIELALRVMRLFDSFGGPDTDNLWWRTDSEYAPVTMIVNCNDLFMWACADAECITPENIEALEQTVAEVAAIDDCLVDEGVLLWCCRQRGFRPQQPYYKHLDAKLHPLFDACGPRVGEMLEASTPDTPATRTLETQSVAIGGNDGPED